MRPQEIFEQIAINETSKLHVELGKMMSAPGIQYKSKNYAFFYKEEMCFKLGKEFDIDQYHIEGWSHLSPFKTKPPLTAWYIIPSKDAHIWAEFTTLAYEYIKLEVG